MRNTFVKLFLAVAMCFMIGSALVACGGDIKLGVDENGYITVNDVATDVKVSGNDVACKEHNVVVSVVKEHTADAEGIYLETCTLCSDYAKVVTDSKHDFEEGVKQAATCDANAFEGQVCKICGARGAGNEVENTKGHVWTAQRALGNTMDATPCTDGGIAVKHCERCMVVSDPEVVEAVGHTADVWNIATYPNGGAGLAKAECVYCDADIEYLLPALDIENKAYTFEYKDGVEPTCKEGAIGIFTYAAEPKKNSDDVWNTNIKFTCEGAVPATGHFIAGKKLSEWKNTFGATDGAYPYYADVNGDEKVAAGETLGLSYFSDTKITCTKADDAFFVCGECNETVKVKAYMDHNGARQEKEAAYCYKPGKDVVACTFCKTNQEVATYVDHDFEHKFVAYDANGDEIKVVTEANEDSIAYFKHTYTCKAIIPEHKVKDEITGVETTVKATACTEGNDEVGKNIDADAVVYLDTVESTCYAQGYDLYEYTTYKADGETVDKVYEIKAVREKAPHTLNGKTLDKYVDDAGNERITVDIPGINAFSETPFDTCGKTEGYPAFFTCSECVKGGAKLTTVNVTAYKDHVFKKTVEENGEPTCTKTGKQTVICTYEGCNFTGTDADKIIPALGHKYTYATVISDGKLSVTATCSVCSGITDPTKVEPNSKVELKGIALSNFITKAADGSNDVTKKLAVKQSCLTPEINKYTVALALNITAEEVDDLDNIVTPDDPATPEDETVYGKKTVYSYAIGYATVEDPKAKVKTYEEDYTFVVTFELKKNNVLDDHNFSEDETKYLKTVVERDWNEDGEIDQIFTYIYDVCRTCNSYELVDIDVESLTEYTEADAPVKK